MVGANIVDKALTKKFNHGLKTVIPKKIILCVFIIYLLFLSLKLIHFIDKKEWSAYIKSPLKSQPNLTSFEEKKYVLGM